MKSNQPEEQQLALQWLFGIGAAFSLLIAIIMPVTQGNAVEAQDYALGVVFFGLAVGFIGCYLIAAANDPLTAINKMSVMVLFVMGCITAAFFLTFVFTDPPSEREYAVGAICGLPSLFMAIMGIILYQHELQRLEKHPFDDPAAQIDALKNDEPSLVPTRLGLLLAALLLVIIIFDVWSVVTVPFPQ